METNRILALLKFGKKKHIEDFVHGRLYMNTLQYFAEMEADKGDDPRCDPFEGVGRLIQANGATLSVKIEGAFQPVGQIVGPMQWRPTGGIKANVFCMYALRPPSEPDLINELNFRFGDTFAVLKDGDEFLRRVRTAPQPDGHELAYRPVEYVDENKHNGPMGIFKKRSAFSYQSELRIALIPGTDKPHVLTVGDLSDIAITGSLADVNRLFRIVTPSDAEDRDRSSCAPPE